MSPLDAVCYWSILAIPFVIGILSGGQTIYSKEGADFFGVLTSVWGWIYWISRGLIPVGSYLVWYFAQSDPSQSYAAAAICGLGSEAILRSKLYVTSKTEGGKTDDVFKGLFDLIEWWQSLCLRQAGISRAGARQDFVREQFGTLTDFPTFGQKMKLNAGVFSQEVAGEIAQKIDSLLATFQVEAAKPNVDKAFLHRAYIFKLGYALLDSVGKSGIRTLNK